MNPRDVRESVDIDECGMGVIGAFIQDDVVVLLAFGEKKGNRLLIKGEETQT